MSRWFLPETPDVVAMLRTQTELTIAGIDALVRWAEGDGAAADDVRRLEHEADDAKRALRTALRDAFTVPVDAEDLYTLSERLDALLNGAKDTVREADVMTTPPDQAMATMAHQVAAGVHRLAAAIEGLGGRDDPVIDRAMDEADAGIKQGRKLEHTYRKAMSALLDVDDVREVAAKRELYRRFDRLGDLLVQIGDRIWYAAVKES